MDVKDARELAQWIQGLVSEGTYNSVTGEGDSLPTSRRSGASFEVTVSSGTYVVQVTRVK